MQEPLRSVQLIQATRGGCAAILESGAVVTPEFGGNSSQVQEQLRNVQRIQSTCRAFAAILESGAVVTWGHAEYSGDSSQVQEQLAHTRRIWGLLWPAVIQNLVLPRSPGCTLARVRISLSPSLCLHLPPRLPARPGRKLASVCVYLPPSLPCLPMLHARQRTHPSLCFHLVICQIVGRVLASHSAPPHLSRSTP